VDLWNVFDISSIVLNFTLITLDLMYSGVDEQEFDYVLRQISAIACFLMYVKVFYFLRIFKTTAPLVRMIVDVTASIKVFILVFFIALIATANAFYILTRDVKEKQFIENPIDAVLYAYFISLGEFDYDFSGDDKWLSWAFFLISTFVLLIVLLNLIIAIMGSAYAKLEELQESALVQESLQMIMENSFLIDRKEHFKNVSYLISVREDDEDEEEELEAKMRK